MTGKREVATGAADEVRSGIGNRPGMTGRRKLAIGAAVAATILVAGLLAYAFLMPADKRPAPDFSITDVDGNAFNLSDYRGKVVLVEFTAVNCAPCREYMPNLVQLRGHFDRELVMISIFTYEFESAQAIKDEQVEYGANWTFAKDPSHLDVKYGAGAIPKTYLIDRDGNIFFEGTGKLELSQLEGPIGDALRGQAKSSISVGSAFIAELGLAGMALMAGLVCFFSPCAFPMLPGYMTLYLRGKDSERPYRQAALGGTVAASGIFLVYALMGLVVVAVGGAITPYIKYFGPVIGTILVVLGILLLLPITFVSGRFLERIGSAQEGKGFYYGLLLYGIGYGAASQACTAPVFIGAILAGFQTGTVLTGIGVLLLASTVAFLLMIAVTLLVAGSKKAVLNRLKSSTEIIKKVSAVILIIAGIYLLVEYWRAFGS